MKALIEAGADINISKTNGDTLIHEAAIYDSADCLIELAAQGLAINVKNNLMRTPIYLAEKKRSKYAYQALINLTKAITMANAYTDRKYGDEMPSKNLKQMSLKNSLKKNSEIGPTKKNVRIMDNSEKYDYSVEDDHKTMEPDDIELIARNKQLNNLEKLINLRESFKASKDSLGSFGFAANQAREYQNDDNEQDQILKAILQQEKEEIRKVEQQLRFSEVEKQKQEQAQWKGQIEKAKRWNVIDQKREIKDAQRKQALAEETDPFKIAEQLEAEEEQRQLAIHSKNIDLSSVTDDEVREQNMKNKENEGKTVTFKKFLHDKRPSQPKSQKLKSAIKNSLEQEDQVMMRESHPAPIQELSPYEEEKETPQVEESDIDDELDFTNKNRSFDKHPLEGSYDSKVEEDDIRMSKNTLRQIKVKTRNRSQGPPGRTFAYFDARDLAQRSMTRLGNLFSRFRKFLGDKYENLYNWYYIEESDIPKRKKKRYVSEEKKQLPTIDEMQINGQDINEILRSRQFSKERPLVEVAQNILTPKANSKTHLEKYRPHLKTAEQLAFEEVESFNSDQPSFILQKKIEKLKQEEMQLKEFEKKVAEEIRNLKQQKNQKVVDQTIDEITEKVDQKTKKSRKKKKKSKKYHDMKRMKQEHIKKILNQEDQQESSNSNKNNMIIVKDFKSDHESPPPQRENKNNELVDTVGKKDIQIKVGSLEIHKKSADTEKEYLKVEERQECASAQPVQPNLESH